jgi:hypothetical protein
MTNINPKLTAVITTIALLAPAAGASAHASWASRPAHHYATARSERHIAAHHARRPTTKFQPDSRSI